MSVKIKDTGRKFGNFVADKIDFNDLVGGFAGKIAEAADNPLFSFTFAAAFSKIPEEQDEKVEGIVNSIISGDLDELQSGLLDELVDIIKTPAGDERERIVLSHLLGIARELIEIEMRTEDEAQTIESSVGGGGPGDDPDD